MAIRFQEISDKLFKTPLTEGELMIIGKVEDIIDEQIRQKYKGDSVYIELLIVKFNNYSDIPQPRRTLMTEELKSRYEKAGWIWKVEISDYRDSNPADYLKLSGKIK